MRPVRGVIITRRTFHDLRTVANAHISFRLADVFRNSKTFAHISFGSVFSGMMEDSLVWRAR
jgi:hypothetical protein